MRLIVILGRTHLAILGGVKNLTQMFRFAQHDRECVVILRGGVTKNLKANTDVSLSLNMTEGALHHLDMPRLKIDTKRVAARITDSDIA
ncbi:hypothetical protein AGMMS50229_18770 [Campylobacterota bacterium]|nr:hypothetical protein AGMMS50229_18770 [Campylobacterota bacterium]